MKKIGILSMAIVSLTLFSFTSSKETKGEKVFEVDKDGTLYILPGQGHKISYEDALVLSQEVTGWVACETKSVLNQCETKMAIHPDNDVLSQLIAKYND